MRFIILFAFTACVNLPHVDPQPRLSDTDQRHAAVRVISLCSEATPFEDTSGFDSGSPTPSMINQPINVGMGGIINDRTILTAAHVVACPLIPKVFVVFWDGTKRRVNVVRDEHLFGDGSDIAVLEAASLQNFGMNIAPPTINYFSNDYLPTGQPHHGSSGAFVYDRTGSLVGLVSEGYPCFVGDTKLGCGAKMERLWDSFVCKESSRFGVECNGHAVR